MQTCIQHFVLTTWLHGTSFHRIDFGMLFSFYFVSVTNSFLTIAAATTTNHWKLNYSPYINEHENISDFLAAQSWAVYKQQTAHTNAKWNETYTCLHCILETKTRWHIMKFGANGMKPKYFRKESFFFAHSYGASSESINMIQMHIHNNTQQYIRIYQQFQCSARIHPKVCRIWFVNPWNSFWFVL